MEKFHEPQDYRETQHQILMVLSNYCSYEQWKDFRRQLAEMEVAKPTDGTRNSLAYKNGSTRFKLRTGRFLYRRLELNSFLDDDTLRKISDEINVHLFGCELKIRIDKGRDIYNNYRDAIGSRSCMTGTDAPCVGLYVDNPDIFSQLIMTEGRDSARAMIIKLDNGTTLLDRIYSSSKYLTGKMFDYAKENNWHYREYTDADSDSVVFESGGYHQLVATVSNYSDGHIPYADTMRHFRIDNNGLKIFHENTFRESNGTMTSTCGDLCYTKICYHCGDNTEGDFYSDSSGHCYCGECFDELFQVCDDCGRYHRIIDVTYLEHLDSDVCDECLENSYTLCDDCNRYFPNEDITEIVDGDYICDECLADYDRCSVCNEYYPLDDIHGFDGKAYCPDCFIEVTENIESGV